MRSRIVRSSAIALLALLGHKLQAQNTSPSAQPSFEVASIKENTALGTGGGMRLLPGGGVRVQHLPARFLITIAYDLQPFQLIDAPGWTLDTYYDVNAKAEGTATREQTFVMLQALLVDRFKLAFHRETRQMDGFALVQARSGSLGPGLRRSTVDCEKMFATTPRCKEGRITSTTMKGNGVPMWSVLQLVVAQARAPVSDDTQLTGTFDVDLRWSDDVAPTGDLPSFFTALQEQLGLKLERRRVPAEVFVIDRIERPTPD